MCALKWSKAMGRGVLRVVFLSWQFQIPQAWWHGRMVVVPRKPSMPVSINNSRGVLVSSQSKVVAKTARRQEPTGVPNMTAQHFV